MLKDAALMMIVRFGPRPSTPIGRSAGMLMLPYIFYAVLS